MNATVLLSYPANAFSLQRRKRSVSALKVCMRVVPFTMLSHFIYNGINMNHIESRPVQGKNWEYRFFVDFEGNLNDAAVQNALRGLTEETLGLKILGNY